MPVPIVPTGVSPQIRSGRGLRAAPRRLQPAHDLDDLERRYVETLGDDVIGLRPISPWEKASGVGHVAAELEEAEELGHAGHELDDGRLPQGDVPFAYVALASRKDEAADSLIDHAIGRLSKYIRNGLKHAGYVAFKEVEAEELETVCGKARLNARQCSILRVFLNQHYYSAPEENAGDDQSTLPDGDLMQWFLSRKNE